MQAVRGHREGSIFRRKTGRDAGVWVSAVTMRDGRRVSRTSHSRDDAKAELAELIRLRDARAPITDRIRLGDYLGRWVNEPRSLAPATRRKHEQIIRLHIVPVLGHVRLSELSTADVGDLLASLGLADRSVGHVRATLRRCLADAVRDGLVSRNVGALAVPPRQSHADRPILDATQARRLIDATRGTRYGPLWTVLLTTGLRISEALGLAWSAVDLAAPSITVRHQLAREDGKWVRRKPKTDKGRRTIPLTPLGVEALRAQQAMQEQDRGGAPRPIDGLVFLSPAGRPLHSTNTLADLYADLDRAKLPRVTQHDLRHSAATILYSMGIPIESIADMLGHSTTRVTADLYRHRVESMQREAADAMQRALG